MSLPVPECTKKHIFGNLQLKAPRLLLSFGLNGDGHVTPGGFFLFDEHSSFALFSILSKNWDGFQRDIFSEFFS